MLTGVIENGEVDITFVPFARRRYHVLRADVTDTTPERALQAVLPDTAASDLCRVILTGGTDERGVDVEQLHDLLIDARAIDVLHKFYEGAHPNFMQYSNLYIYTL